MNSGERVHTGKHYRSTESVRIPWIDYCDPSAGIASYSRYCDLGKEKKTLAERRRTEQRSGKEDKEKKNAKTESSNGCA